MSSVDEDELFGKLNSTDPTPPAKVEETRALAKHEQQEKNADDDYNYTRDKLKGIIEQSEDVLECAADIAKETGEPRSIEVYSQLAKTMGDLARSVMENSKTKSAVDKDRGFVKNPNQLPEGSNVTQNNQTIFVGTTKELAEMMRKAEQSEAEVINIEES